MAAMDDGECIQAKLSCLSVISEYRLRARSGRFGHQDGGSRCVTSLESTPPIMVVSVCPMSMHVVSMAICHIADSDGCSLWVPWVLPLHVTRLLLPPPYQRSSFDRAPNEPQ
jgi:hypothetical protein